MSELSVHLLLETSGANLTVTVARYLHAEMLQKVAAIRESKKLRLSDEQCTDKRLLDWVEAGITVADDLPFSIRIDGQNELSKERTEIVDETTRKNMAVLSEKKTGLFRYDEDQNDRTWSSASFPRKQSTPLLSQPSQLSTVSSNGDVASVIVSLSIREQHKVPFQLNDDRSRLEESDDGNAWFNCVCMQSHDETVDVFWVQCGLCCSWYNVARGCVGFGEEQAALIKWTCPGCPEDSSDNNSLGQEPTSAMMKSFLPASPGYDCLSGSPERPENDEQVQTTASPSLIKHYTPTQLSQEKIQRTNAQSLVKHQRGPHPIDVMIDQKEANDAKSAALFNVGDRVNVKQHSWAYLNHPEGLAVILKAYSDKDGDHVYDIKYVIERSKKKGVMERYLTLAF